MLFGIRGRRRNEGNDSLGRGKHFPYSDLIREVFLKG